MINVYMTLGVVAFGVLAFGFAIWAAERKGRMDERVERAEQDAKNARKAGAVVAEHRSDDDTAERLRNGNF